MAKANERLRKKAIKWIAADTDSETRVVYGPGTELADVDDAQIRLAIALTGGEEADEQLYEIFEAAVLSARAAAKAKADLDAAINGKKGKASDG